MTAKKAKDSKPASKRATRSSAAAPVTAAGFAATRDAAALLPPNRDNAAAVSPDRALTLGAVFRAVQIIAGVVGQLTIAVTRDGQPVVDGLPLLIRQPEIGRSTGSTLRRTAASLACHGNAYWRVSRSDKDGSPVAITVLDPKRVQVVVDPVTEQVSYQVTGRRATVSSLTPADRLAGDVMHLRLLELAGNPVGLGPIQAARADLAGSLDVRDWGANWFGGSGIPIGVLSTDQPLTPTQAAAYAEYWETARATSATAVLGKGLGYTSSLLNPSDALWLDAQRFGISAVARLFGIPSTWLLADAGQGGNLTYSNLQDARSDAILTTFLSYSAPIEEAFTVLTPRGQSVELRPDGLLRASTNQRYASYTQGLAGGWLTLPEIRALEGLGPLPGTTPEGQTE